MNDSEHRNSGQGGSDAGRPVAGMEQLPRSLEPATDLWPRIEPNLAPRTPAVEPSRRAWGLSAVAASVAVAFLAGVLLGRVDPSPEALPFLSASEFAGRSMAPTLEAAELEYQAAWKGFEPVGVAPSLLESRTRDDIERSWLTLKEAEAALTSALEEHPDNAYLGQKLLDLRAQQLDFMRQLHMLDQNSRRST